MGTRAERNGVGFCGARPTCCTVSRRVQRTPRRTPHRTHKAPLAPSHCSRVTWVDFLTTRYRPTLYRPHRVQIISSSAGQVHDNVSYATCRAARMDTPTPCQARIRCLTTIRWRSMGRHALKGSNAWSTLTQTTRCLTTASLQSSHTKPSRIGWVRLALKLNAAYRTMLNGSMGAWFESW